MTNGMMDFNILPEQIKKNSYTFTVHLDFKLLHDLQQNFSVNAQSFWFRFFGESDVYAQRFDGLTDITFHLELAEDANIDPELAEAILTRLSKRPAWGEHVGMLTSPNIDAICISCQNFKSDAAPRPPSSEERSRLEVIRAAFEQIHDADGSNEEVQNSLATKVVTDLLLGEFDDDERGTLATIIGVWIGDRVAALTGLEWHCIDESSSVTYCIHNPATKVSCFPFDAMNKRINAQEAFQPHLLAASFAVGLKGRAEVVAKS